ncbi:[protein-PII] uridylyltransferase [Nocardioides sp. JQ2195]|uniref:[protein-PII] uridylyltransferase n=1 Tax=Nocardioides sp. JQ2195 TaxID=2592334 RepID=UPI00143E244C|nr:[protein-PII] uridylyltransferase [Nocardioides sp. JQ2195]QIX26209.1 [protein-PII] uridylyltransferase [Nocardioides sp. JQ2195]
MTAAERRARSDAADALCHTAYDDLAGPDTGIALVAVGGYGRRELAPYSDLDLVLVHDDRVEPGSLAQQVWYPLWDSGVDLDHSVRSLSETVQAASDDLRVALGMQDVRFLAGDGNLALRLRTTMLAQWRREAKGRLPELRALVEQRHALMGELAHASVPDLKESQGGLRDATVVKALVATWLIDAPHVELERCRQELLDVRDVVHDIVGRRNDRMPPEVWGQLPGWSGVAEEGGDGILAAQAKVRDVGRRITHISGLAWRRVDDVLARPRAVGARRPDLRRIAPGIAISKGEVVLDRGARPADDPLLLLRAAAEAAERDLVLAPPTAARLVREVPALPDPWPVEARQLLVRMLASGRGLLGVWATLDQTGALRRILPEWEQIRSLPHASAIHRFTVDRHVVETCVEAAALIRGVARPDVLLVAALLHDIGKGQLGDHSTVGEPIARAVAARMGFSDDEVDLVATLVRWHLLLSGTATTRDPDDPATIEAVVSRVQSAEALDLLLALTEADARAASAKAWSSWRAGLVRQLAQRCGAALAASGPTGVPGRPAPAASVGATGAGMAPVPAEVRVDGTAIVVTVAAKPYGSRVTVVSGDRIGLLADASAMLALQRTSVLAARAWTHGRYGVSEWQVADPDLDATVLRQRINAIAAGRIDVTDRLAGRRSGGSAESEGARLAPSVQVRPEASHRATVLEVRTDDRPGVVHLVCAALAELDISVRSAHVDTLGPQAIDVFYLQEVGAGALGDERAASAAHAVRAALGQ